MAAYAQAGPGTRLGQVPGFGSLPPWHQHLLPLRDALRAGLKDCFVFDLVNANINILLERHPPAEGSALLEYCQNREAVLQQTHADRGTAKNLFLRLLYGGSVQNWKKVHNIDTFATELLAARFALEMRQIRKADCGANAEKMKQVTPRPAEYLQCALNTAKERELIDKAHPGCRRRRWHGSGVGAQRPVCAFAGGGVRDVQPRHAVRPWRKLPVHLQPTPSVEKALEGKACDVPGPAGPTWSCGRRWSRARQPQPHSAHLPSCAARVFCLRRAGHFRFAFFSFKKISCAKPARRWPLYSWLSVIDNMIVFQKPFPGAARTELESQLARRQGERQGHVECKMDLERSSSRTPPATARSSRAAGAARLWRPGTCG